MIFSSRVRFLVVAIAALSAIGLLASLVFGRALFEPPPRATDAHTFGPLGHGAAMKLYERLGMRVERARDPHLAEIELPLLVIEPETFEARVSTGEGGVLVSLEDVIARRRLAHRKTVLVLPKWQLSTLGAVKRMRIPSALLKATGLDLTVVEDGRSDSKRQRVVVEGELGHFEVSLPSPQRIKGERMLVGDAGGSLVVSDVEGMVLVVADPDLLHNFNFDQGQNAELMMKLFRRELGGNAVALEEVLHGAIVRRSILDVFAKWPGPIVIGYATLVILVLSWLVATRLPPHAPPPVLDQGPKHAISVSGSVLAAGAKAGRLEKAYVESTLRYAALRIALPARTDLLALAKSLDEVARARGFEGATKLVESMRAGSPDLALAQSTRAFVERLVNVGKNRGT